MTLTNKKDLASGDLGTVRKVYIPAAVFNCQTVEQPKSEQQQKKILHKKNKKSAVTLSSLKIIILVRITGKLGYLVVTIASVPTLAAKLTLVPPSEYPVSAK